MKDMDIKAVFIGDKSENGAFYKMQLNKMVDEHLGWRENYLPGDVAAISEADKQAPRYIATREHMWKSWMKSVNGCVQDQSLGILLGVIGGK